MKKELIALADLLDKRGLQKEADLVDRLLHQAADAAGVAQSLAQALEGIASNLESLSNPNESARMNEFVKQLMGAKQKFETETVNLSKLLNASSSPKMNREAVVTKEMVDHVQKAAKPLVNAAKSLANAVKNLKNPQAPDLDKIKKAFEPINAFIEKLQRASGS